jgi:hypothetical protein
MSTLNNIFKKIEDKTELSSHKVELGLLDDINKMKKDIVSSWKNHVNKRDSFGADSTKIIQLISQHNIIGNQLKKEVDLLDKQVVDLSSMITKLRNQAKELGLELPQETLLLDGVQLGVWGNKFVDTREIVDEFSNKIK